MRELPRGTVTFLFTDIEGSTRLLDQLGAEEYGKALAEHRRVLRAAFGRHGGVEVDTQGDAFFVAFPTATGALAAAREAQEALVLPVRMGLHTGTPNLIAEGYVGADVHLGARIAAVGHGRQVLVSAATAALVDGELKELGEHRVKDFDEPVAILQLGRAEFPPLKTIANTNLPRPASTFVGREREVGDVAGLVRANRLVTLSGPGGTGKTRLAIEAAAELVGDFPAGVFWVGLATVVDPALVVETIGQTLGAPDGVAGHVSDRRMLLLLDNLEQVIEAAPELARLVEDCPNLALLTTSRELLRVRGEVEYEVLPLADPEAVELFCLRAQIDASPAVEELCRRLDNLPLALELAAARAKALTPEQILERLSQRLDLLRGGRDADPRQVTLRTTIEWSHGLLTEPERMLFRRLSVFAGGCTLAAAEEVAEADLDTLQSVVEKSLVRHTVDRFWMLETIREFALEQLGESDDAQPIRERHLAWLVSLVCEVEPRLRGPEQEECLDLLEAERANIRAALDYARSSGAAADELRIAVALRDFWNYRGPLVEAQRWLEEAAAGVGEDLPELRAEALHAASYHAFKAGDFAHARDLAGELYDLARASGGIEQEIFALTNLANVSQGDGDLAQARRHSDRAIELARELGSARHTAVSLLNRGDIANSEGDYNLALELCTESVAISESIGDAHVKATGLMNLAVAQIQLGDITGAESSLHALVQLPGLAKDVDVIANVLLLAASTAERGGDGERAGRLLGAADAIREEAGTPLEPTEAKLHDATVDALTATLGSAALEAARREGRELELADAITLFAEPPP